MRGMQFINYIEMNGLILICSCIAALAAISDMPHETSSCFFSRPPFCVVGPFIRNYSVMEPGATRKSEEKPASTTASSGSLPETKKKENCHCDRKFHFDKLNEEFCSAGFIANLYVLSMEEVTYNYWNMSAIGGDGASVKELKYHVQFIRPFRKQIEGSLPSYILSTADDPCTLKLETHRSYFIGGFISNKGDYLRAISCGLVWNRGEAKKYLRSEGYKYSLKNRNESCVKPEHEIKLQVFPLRQKTPTIL
ncbi:unnamed protein product [Cylicocyclus nassatus]|uniref:Uncharacterized protein n=1 Tax=Cylicocyclus nassatus TaxID=53992 RepID=A0AA36M5W6_CYLNA|nr:unnamed protein product [Cylicocyclus nassatus]